MKTTLGQRIKIIRNARSMTMDKFAQAIGMSQPGLAHIESDRTSPRLENILSIIQNFHVDPAWLITGENPKGLSHTVNEIASKLEELPESVQKHFLYMVEREYLLDKLLKEAELRENMP